MFDQVFPTDIEGEFTNSHGVVVDNQGKLWNAPYLSYYDGTTRTNYLHIYNSDGSKASFSPLSGITINDEFIKFGPLTGINKSPDGKIYLTSHGYRTSAGDWINNKSFIYVLNSNTVFKTFQKNLKNLILLSISLIIVIV
jgi:hypothetical protein